MNLLKRIKDIRASRLNLKEFANFITRTVAHILTATLEKLGIPPEQFESLTAHLATLTDVVAQSQISDETKSIAAQDSLCDTLIRYLFATIDAALLSPVPALREAAQHLANVFKPYRGVQNLPQGQQIQQTRGLLFDAGKPENAAQVTALNLSATLQMLRQENNTYATLIDTRAAEQTARALPAGKVLRDEMIVEYNEIITRAFVASVATPSAEADAFVVAMNKLIDDTTTAYNQRMAQRKKKEDESSPE